MSQVWMKIGLPVGLLYVKVMLEENLMNADIHDQELGKLKWDTTYGTYTRTFQSSTGEQARLVLWMEDVEPHVFVERARQILADFRIREVEVYHAIAMEFLELYNSVWTQGTEMTLEEFVQVLKLERIDIDMFDSLDLWFTAADLFTDHSLHAHLNAQMEIDWTGLEG